MQAMSTLSFHSGLAGVRSSGVGCVVTLSTSRSNITVPNGRRKRGYENGDGDGDRYRDRFLGFLKPIIHYRMAIEGSYELAATNHIHSGGEENVLSLHPNALDANSPQSSIPGIIYPPATTMEKATNIVWQECPVNKVERQKLLGQKGCVIWITGLSGSGKSTLACALSQALYSRGKLSYLLDGDNVRHGLNKNLGFSAEDRTENIRRIGEVAKLFVDSGVICIASFISPYRMDRDACRALLPAGEFIEIFMNFPLQICEERDAKGLYKLARAGKIKGFTGIDDPYEPPESCE
ncbi:hypothetical protein KI387_013191, partial [Taxus chinensis]